MTGLTPRNYQLAVTVNDPWGTANSLEWATSCPPPRNNFVSIPPIRSERPAFDLRYPRLGGTPGEPPETKRDFVDPDAK